VEHINTDLAVYGGSGIANSGDLMTDAIPAHGHAQSLSLTLPPLASLMLVTDGS
jgi:1,4-alpha-glucan branching enzyme